MIWLWFAGAVVISFSVGYAVGHVHEGDYWERRARIQTPVCHRGEFYYVVPEAAYVEIKREARR